MKPLIIYHANCPDGCGAALAAYLKFGEGAEYQGANYGNPQLMGPHLYKRQVYLLDFSYPRHMIEAMISFGATITIVDHHKSAETDLAGLDRQYPDRLSMTFDGDHSGAVLAWRHFHPDAEVPEMLLYVEDGDLWRWALAASREINAAMHSCGLTLRAWISLFKDWSVLKGDLIFGGRYILTERRELVDAMTGLAELVVLEGFAAPAVNAPVLFSEVAIALAERNPPLGIAWHWDGVSQLYRVSLRSVGEFDVSRLAREFGGGGHKNSAGFTCKELPWLKEPVRA